MLFSENILYISLSDIHSFSILTSQLVGGSGLIRLLLSFTFIDPDINTF